MGRKRSIFFNFINSIFCQKINAIDVFFIVLLTLVFFSFPVLLAPDSQSYIKNALSIIGERPFSKWNSVRGPVLPILLAVDFLFVGQSPFALTVLMYIVYLTMMFLTLYLCRLLQLTRIIGKTLTWILCSVFLFLNPTVLSYSHYILTEFFALVFGLAVFCVILKTQRLIMYHKDHRWYVYVIRYAGAVIGTVSLYALKQMFFFLSIASFILSEIVIILSHHRLKQVILSVFALLLLIFTVPTYSMIWDLVLAKNGVSINANYSTKDMAQSTLVDGLRYFKPELRDIYGEPIVIDIMSDGYDEVIDSFTYTFENSIKGSVHYLFTCFTRSPERFISSWKHNYFVISNVRRVMFYTTERAFFPVNQVNHFIYSFETEAWMESFMRMNKDDPLIINTSENEYDRFSQPVDKGILNEVLFSPVYMKFSFFNYSFLLFCAPWIFLISFVMMIVYKKRNNHFWGDIFLISGTVFGTVLFLAITACNIDRYGFPVTIYLPILLFIIFTYIFRVTRHIVHRNKRHRIVN